MITDVKSVLICFSTMQPSVTNCHLHCVYLLMFLWASHFTTCPGVRCVYHPMLHWAPHFTTYARGISFQHVFDHLCFFPLICYLNWRQSTLFSINITAYYPGIVVVLFSLKLGSVHSHSYAFVFCCCCCCCILVFVPCTVVASFGFCSFTTHLCTRWESR